MIPEPTERQMEEFAAMTKEEQVLYLARRAEALKQQEKELEAFKTIFQALNWMGHEEEVWENLVFSLQHEHRTLQANFWRMIQEAAKKYAEFNTDPRNEKAVEFAKKVAKIDVYIPFI